MLTAWFANVIDRSGQANSISRLNHMLLRISTLSCLLCFLGYSIAPIYIVQASSDGTGRMSAHDRDMNAGTIANRHFRLPGIEEMNGDFHHHDARGNNPVIKASAHIRPAGIITYKLPPQPTSHNATSVVHVAYIHMAMMHGIHDGFISEKTSHSPPGLLS
jgi:hypothetical protein